jgi:hypothetical protein
MLNTRNLVEAILAGFLLSGCMTIPKSYLDPSVPKVSYENLTIRTEPLKLKLTVEFQRNGNPLPEANPTLRDVTERILWRSGLIIASDQQAVGEIKVVVNNIADIGTAIAKGVGSGLTLGLIGTTAIEQYEMTITIKANGKSSTRKEIKEKFYTASGNTTLPSGAETFPPKDAFRRVMEQMLLRALQDMQRAGELTETHLPAHIPFQLATLHHTIVLIQPMETSEFSSLAIAR